MEAKPDFQNNSQYHDAQDDGDKDQVQRTVQNEQAYLKNQAEPEKQSCYYPEILQPVPLLFPVVLRLRYLAFGANTIFGGQCSTALGADGACFWIGTHFLVTRISCFNKVAPVFTRLVFIEQRFP